VAYRLSSAWQFKARLDNVTDEKYQTVYGYNQQPLSLYAGVTWTPKH
jgi:vitamin B12 transporter